MDDCVGGLIKLFFSFVLASLTGCATYACGDYGSPVLQCFLFHDHGEARGDDAGNAHGFLDDGGL